MGASCDDFTTDLRTPHRFGSRGTDDDKHHGQQESLDCPQAVWCFDWVGHSNNP